MEPKNFGPDQLTARFNVEILIKASLLGYFLLLYT